MSSLIVRIKPKTRQETCGQITYEEAKSMYEKGLALQRECAVLCGMSVGGFHNRLRNDGILSKVVKSRREYAREGLGIISEERKRAELKMKKYHANSRLSEKAAKARELGMSYGQYSAMLRMREKKVTPLKPAGKPRSWMFKKLMEEK